MRILIGWLGIWERIKKIYFDEEVIEQHFHSFVELFSRHILQKQ